MADTKISGLPLAAALTGSEPVAIVQAGSTVQTSVSSISAGVFIVAEPTTGPFTVTNEDAVYCNSGFSDSVTLPATGSRVTLACDVTSNITSITSTAGVQGPNTVLSDTARVFFFTITDGWRQE